MWSFRYPGNTDWLDCKNLPPRSLEAVYLSLNKGTIYETLKKVLLPIAFN